MLDAEHLICFLTLLLLRYRNVQLYLGKESKGSRLRRLLAYSVYFTELKRTLIKV